MTALRGQGPWPTTNAESAVFGWMSKRLDQVEASERSGMVRWLLEHVSGKSRGARIAEDTRWTESQLDRLAVCAERLNAGEPLQYVLGEAWFDGLCLHVTPAVLIPRPESRCPQWFRRSQKLVPHSSCLFNNTYNRIYQRLNRLCSCYSLRFQPLSNTFLSCRITDSDDQWSSDSGGLL